MNILESLKKIFENLKIFLKKIEERERIKRADRALEMLEKYKKEKRD